MNGNDLGERPAWFDELKSEHYAVVVADAAGREFQARCHCGYEGRRRRVMGRGGRNREHFNQVVATQKALCQAEADLHNGTRAEE